MRQLAVAWVLASLLAVCAGGPTERSTEETADGYWRRREELVAEDTSTRLGSDLKLSWEEEVVNDKLTFLLKKEMDEAFDTLDFPPGENFLTSKQKINNSEVFQLIKRMPKGAILHLHDLSIPSLEFFISNLTYMEHLQVCETDSLYTFRFFAGSPPVECAAGWRTAEEVRANVTDFDERIRRQLSLVTDHPHEAYPDINTVWEKFEQYFIVSSGVLSYRPAFQRYLWGGMEEMLQDGAIYFEFRGVLAPLYELDGTVLSPEDTVGVYRDVVQAFNASHQEFFGARYIYGPPRGVDNATMDDYVNTTLAIKERFPEFMAGFDLVGQEDRGQPLAEFIPQLQTLAEHGVPFFFHAGETDWLGESTDENLYDALLLNTTRIGHGFALDKHPKLLQMARERDIPIEVNPISNQVLMLLTDLRNHPATGWFATSQPLVVSSDDPPLWDALPLSHDYYEALLAFGGRRADLRTLKQLAINSVRYSSLSPTDKGRLMDQWEAQWKNFVALETNSVL